MVDASGDGLMDLIVGTGPSSQPRVRMLGLLGQVVLDVPLTVEFLGGVFVG
jgi:hypothetical protein